MRIANRDIDLEIPRKFLGLLDPWRYKVFHGGRGGVKSWTFGRVLIIKVIQRRMRILCGREFQASIADSVHSLLADQIKLLKVDDLFSVKQKTIECKNGSRFIFAGMHHNIDSIKSKEAIDIAWIEEANTLSRNSLETLAPTIRKDGSEIWFSFNCDSEEDPVYHDFVVNNHPDALVVKTTYRDNPWFPEVLRREMEWTRAHDTDKYLHIWEGEPRKHSEAQIFYGKWRIASFDAPDDAHFYYGADWGFSTDPTALVRSYIVDNTLYIDREAYAVGVEIDELPELFDPVLCDHKWFHEATKDNDSKERREQLVRRARQQLITADSARPDTISYLKRRGFNIRGAKKGKGSIEDGIEFLKSFDEIVVHERCKHVRDELRLYQYKLDRLTGEPTTQIEDKHNHTLDAERYALENVQRQKATRRVYMNVAGI